MRALKLAITTGARNGALRVKKLGIFSVAGEALNFGARRMETIIRVAWLPLVLMLITNMSMVFLLLSSAKGELMTLADVSSFQNAEKHALNLINMGIVTGSKPVLTIVGATVLINAILVSSFMAPLTRLAGLGEHPAPGVVKAPFGLDQIRYLISGLMSVLFLCVALAPMLFVSFNVVNYIQAALSKIYTRFPNENSLHTIELATGGDVLLERGQQWIYSLGVPLAAAAPFFLLFWALLVFHFRPQNRMNAGAPNLLLRALAILLVLAVMLVAVPSILLGGAAQFSSEGLTFTAIYGLAIAITAYAALRIFPYQGVVVNRRSFAPAGMLSVTRGWNLFRLATVLLLLFGALILIQLALGVVIVPVILSTLLAIFNAVSSYTKLMSGGEEATWLLPTVIWIWTGFNIFLNMFWAFFTYGVAAGLAGRLYRESEAGH